MNHWVCQAIRLYQKWLSPVLPRSCRFYPSCSGYAMVSFERYPFFQASWLVVGRLCRCHPLHPGGFDPVPEIKS